MAGRDRPDPLGDGMRHWAVYLAEFTVVLAVGAILSERIDWALSEPQVNFPHPEFIARPAAEQLGAGPSSPMPAGTDRVRPPATGPHPCPLGQPGFTPADLPPAFHPSRRPDN